MTALGNSNHTDMTVAGYKGEPVPLRTLLHDHTSEREVHVAVTADNMHAYMKLTPGDHFSSLDRDGIVALLAEAGVVHGLVEPGIVLFVATQNSSAPYTGFFELASGTPMRRGEHGSIEFHVQPTSLEPRYDESDSGAIDFKQLNLIENCFAGQRVATILPPGPGVEGKDVFGHVIPARPGDPVRVQAGGGLVASANDRDFTSEIEGRLVFEDNVLSVSPLLEISRDIDYSVGNLDFVGKIVVKGSLLDGFYINAKRGVELQGEVGAGRITTEGDVKITGGIRGKNAAIITCRNLTAHYIDDAVVEAMGSVTATKEILNSSVKALGRITVTAGTIVGGEVCGFQGVEADTIGSEMGVATTVMAGLNWTEENRKDEIRAQMAEYLDRVQSGKVLLEPLLADKDIMARLGSEQKSMLSDLISELRHLRESLTALLEERAGIDDRTQDGMVNQINVRKTLHQGVTVRFSRVENEMRDTVKGPVSLTQDPGKDVVGTGTLKDMPKLVTESVSELAARAAAETAGAEGTPRDAAAAGVAPEPEGKAETPDPEPQGDGAAPAG